MHFVFLQLSVDHEYQMQSSEIYPYISVVCRRDHVLFTLFVCVWWCPTDILLLMSCVPNVISFSGLSVNVYLSYSHVRTKSCVVRTGDLLRL